MEAKEMVAALIKRARAAQKIADGYSQEKVDELVKAISWAIVKKENSEKIARLAVDESQLGHYEGKYGKLQKKIRGVVRDVAGVKSVGIIERDEKKGLLKIAKPVGVIGALVPCTNPEATPVIKAINSVKGRNAIIFAPHPRTKKTNTLIMNIMRDALKRHGAPEDLIIGIEEPSMDASGELMAQCDLVVATGGAGMVKAAYSSGTPAYGVGAGNVVVVVDETADFKDSAKKIMLSKTFDLATSCSADNNIVLVDSVYSKMLDELKAVGGYMCSADEKAKLQKAVFPDNHLGRDHVAQTAQKIASLAGFKIPESVTFLLVEEEGVGPAHPFSGEKMSVIAAVHKVKDFKDAIDKVNEITSYQGAGHSCGLYSTDMKRIEEYGLKTKTSRVMIRQPQVFGNSGNWDNGLPFTLTLGCGTWGGNISSENITWKHFINITWLSMPIPEVIPKDEDLFGDIMKE
ncbi:MAG: aldehyde dehydrogenase family protein [Spirochaetales bacterium]|nr:aldehyde dehydrogenase family protein [Spirochaetales bacterium]